VSIIQSKPILKEMIWGGDLLKKKRGKKTDLIPSQAVGESWEISDPKFPLMLKIINAEADLSIQVHPSDEYASKQGKEEAWAILDTKPGARLFCGLKDGVSREQLQRALEGQETQTITDLLQSYTPEIGDVFHIWPGTIHAIGAGITVAEIKQNSHITYRIFDWNRLGLDEAWTSSFARAFDV
jgi:mannose-6-phosphate isomerase